MKEDSKGAYGNLTVLIVDDFATIRRITRNILNELGFGTVIEAEDGDVAVKILEGQKVDLIISDWNMPRMTGLDLLKWVRANSQISSVPFLMITAENQKENVVAALRAKVSQYIVKPFTPATLAEKLANILPKA
jgi:two-component system, chemotaxis family, chemotaxis protein CheY